MWDEDDTTAEMMSDENDTIVYICDNQYELATYENHNYMDILGFGLEKSPDPCSTN